MWITLIPTPSILVEGLLFLLAVAREARSKGQWFDKPTIDGFWVRQTGQCYRPIAPKL